MLARIRKSMEEKDQGFTLIELLVVMIIIGILAAIAIPTFLNQRQKAVDSAVQADLTSIAEQVAIHTTEYDLVPNVSLNGTSPNQNYQLKGTATKLDSAVDRNIGPVSEDRITGIAFVGTPTPSDWDLAITYSGGTNDGAAGATLTYSSDTGMGKPTPKS